MVKNAGFSLGLQMMIGLPGDTAAKALQTAKDIIAWGAEETRIYPCLIIRNTALEDLFKKNTYQPLTLEQATEQTVELYQIFEKAKVKVLRMGLHPSEELNNSHLIAGPYHPHFAEMVFTKLWQEAFQSHKEWPSSPMITVYTHPSQRTYAIGFGASNKKWLQNRYKKVFFEVDEQLKKREFYLKAQMR